MNALLRLFRPNHARWESSRPLSASERMERYSPRHAQEMRVRDALGAAAPRVRVVKGRVVYLALPGRPNVINTLRDH